MTAYVLIHPCMDYDLMYFMYNKDNAIGCGSEGLDGYFWGWYDTLKAIQHQNSKEHPFIFNSYMEADNFRGEVIKYLNVIPLVKRIYL